MILPGMKKRQSEEAGIHEGLYPGRITAAHKDMYIVFTGSDEVKAEVSGKIRYASKDASDFPVVGDFVLMDREKDEGGNASIRYILGRNSLFSRRAAGRAGGIQPVAANIDIVFICMALGRDFNLRRLERYIAIGWDSGAVPVVLLTKADLDPDADIHAAEAASVAPGCDMVVSSSDSGLGIEQIKSYLKEGVTGAFLGSSGVGKSTLVNRIAGTEMAEVSEVRSDGKGRHTTVARRLFTLPGGGMIIDTPGMREIGVVDADTEKTFGDIEELAKECLFRDCRHENEPGCAVREAVESGLISAERLENYKKIRKEAGYEGLSSREIEKEKTERMFREFGGMKNASKFIKEKAKRN